MNTQRFHRLSFVLAILLLLFVAVTVAGKSGSSTELAGEYQWNLGDTGPLSATFKETSADTWKVSFQFRFGKKSHVYRGTAQGSLDSGPLEGKIKHRGRRWNFRGEFEDGVFNGKHYELGDDDKEEESGSLRLERTE